MIKNKKSFLIRSVSLVLSVLILLSLFSCRFLRKPTSKVEIYENIEESLTHDTKNYKYVGYYLDDWGFPNFDSYKVIDWAEKIFQNNYNFEGGLGDTLEHAAKTAEHFLKNYYDEIDLSDRDAVTDAIIASYVYVIGDPYSVYRTPDEFENYDADMSGKFGGIGVVVEYNHTDETIRVSSVNIDSPAEEAGFRVGDYIIGVDGESVADIGYLNAVYKIRGEIGTDVAITVLRGDKELTLTATRAEVVEKTVAYEITDEGYGYIIVNQFKDNTYRQFVEAIDYMESEGVQGIIFDMRGNPGGYLHTVIDMISYLIPSGNVIVSYQFKGQEAFVEKSKVDTNPITKEKSDHVLTVPVVVLCNEYTASAGEIFTASMRDYNDMGIITASIVGKTTYGKGIMQSTTTYTKFDPSSLTLTTAYYNPPCGINYHGIGVSPDPGLEIDNTETEDLQLEAALSELQKLINSQ